MAEAITITPVLLSTTNKFSFFGKYAMLAQSRQRENSSNYSFTSARKFLKFNFFKALTVLACFLSYVNSTATTPVLAVFSPNTHFPTGAGDPNVKSNLT